MSDLNPQAKQLEIANRQLVREALEKISDVMNKVQNHFYMGETCYDVTSAAGGALTLLYVIDDGLSAGARRDARLLRGEWTPEDNRRQI